MCGIVGISAETNVAAEIYDSLLMLQHRGQDAAGMVVCDTEDQLNSRKSMGYVRDVFEQKHMNNLIGNEEISKIISYIFVFVIFIFVGGIVIKFISKLIKWSGASGFDRFLGVLFGLIRGLIVLFVIFLLLPSSLKTTDLISNSKITPIIQKYAPQIEAYFRDLIDNRNIVEETLELIEPLQEELIPESNKENTKDGDS